jgi:hypothetical protein
LLDDVGVAEFTELHAPNANADMRHRGGSFGSTKNAIQKTRYKKRDTA